MGGRKGKDGGKGEEREGVEREPLTFSPYAWLSLPLLSPLVPRAHTLSTCLMSLSQRSLGSPESSSPNVRRRGS